MDSALQQQVEQLKMMNLFTGRLSTSQKTSQELKLGIPRNAKSVRRSITEIHNDTDV